MGWYKKAQVDINNKLPLRMIDWPIEAIKDEVDNYIDIQEHYRDPNGRGIPKLMSQNDRDYVLGLVMKDPNRDWERIIGNYMRELEETSRIEGLDAMDFEERAYGRTDY